MRYNSMLNLSLKYRPYLWLLFFRYLLGNQNRPRSINDIMPMIGARFYTQLDSAQLRSDVIQNEMAKVCHYGFLFFVVVFFFLSFFFFIPSHTKSGGVLSYTLRTLSVRLSSIHLSVHQCFISVL